MTNPAQRSTTGDDSRSASAHRAIERTIAQLEDVVAAETLALTTTRGVDLSDYTARKSQGLLDLNRSIRGIGGVPKGSGIEARLSSLRATLAANQAALKLHLDAVREISNLLTDSLREAESDGTYTRAVRQTPYGSL